MSLRERFFDAFASRPRPEPSRILRPGASDGGDRLRETLAARTSSDLSVPEIGTEVEGRLWMLTGDAFRYFLPAFLNASLSSYESVTVFVSELVGALTEPSRQDVVESLQRGAQAPPGVRLPEGMSDQLRKQQLEWFDSGTPTALFHERVDGMTHEEGAVVLAFLEALKEAHGEDFPFDELDAAIDRHWSRYRTS